LAKRLTETYGRGYKKSNLYTFVTFYQSYPNFFQSLIGISDAVPEDENFQSQTGESAENGSRLMELSENVEMKCYPMHDDHEDYMIATEAE
jgi:hypothetical protein